MAQATKRKQVAIATTASGSPPAAKTVCRSLTWPVWGACTTGDSAGPTKGGVRAFRHACGVAFADAAKCRNFLLASLAAADDAASVGRDEKLPKFVVDTKPIYRLAGEKFPSLDCGSLSALLQEVRAEYLSCRFAVWGRNDQALPTYRSPAPLPIRAAEIDIRRDGVGFVVRASLGGGRGAGEKHNRRNFDLLVPSGGRDWAKNKKHLEALVAGEMKYGGASLRIGSRGDLLLKLAVHLPVRPESSYADRSLVVRTSGEDLLVIDRQEWHGSQIPTFHEDDLRHRIAAHSIWRRRMVEDIKHSPRPRRNTRGMRDALDGRCRKSNDYITDRLHKVAARLAEHVRIHRVGVVVYCDSDRSFGEPHPFPWAKLRGLIRDKLDAMGIPHEGLNGADDQKRIGNPPKSEGSDEGVMGCLEVAEIGRLTRVVTKQSRRLASSP